MQLGSMAPLKGVRVEGLIIFLVVWFVVAQFVLPRFGIRPG